MLVACAAHLHARMQHVHVDIHELFLHVGSETTVGTATGRTKHWHAESRVPPAKSRTNQEAAGQIRGTRKVDAITILGVAFILTVPNTNTMQALEINKPRNDCRRALPVMSR